MGSMLLAAVPSKSSKNTSRIHNPLALPRHAISTLTPSKCGPIYSRNGQGFAFFVCLFFCKFCASCLGASLFLLLFFPGAFCKATLATIDVRRRGGREEGKQATQWRAGERLMDPHFKCIKGKDSPNTNLFDLPKKIKHPKAVSLPRPRAH